MRDLKVFRLRPAHGDSDSAVTLTPEAFRALRARVAASGGGELTNGTDIEGSQRLAGHLRSALVPPKPVAGRFNISQFRVPGRGVPLQEPEAVAAVEEVIAWLEAETGLHVSEGWAGDGERRAAGDAQMAEVRAFVESRLSHQLAEAKRAAAGTTKTKSKKGRKK